MSFRPGKAVEIETEFLDPPVFKIFSMFAPHSLKITPAWLEHCGVRLSSQHRGTNHNPTLGRNVTNQVRQCAALPNEVVNNQI